jgi:hypothetical protein
MIEQYCSGRPTEGFCTVCGKSAEQHFLDNSVLRANKLGSGEWERNFESPK